MITRHIENEDGTTSVYRLRDGQDAPGTLIGRVIPEGTGYFLAVPGDGQHRILCNTVRQAESFIITQAQRTRLGAE